MSADFGTENSLTIRRTLDIAIRAEYDAEADAIYVTMREGSVALTVSLDDRRNVDYDTSGNVLGYEFLGVSDPVPLEEQKP